MFSSFGEIQNSHLLKCDILIIISNLRCNVF